MTSCVQVALLVSRAPSLIMLNQDTLTTKLQLLAQALHCDLEQASALVSVNFNVN